MEGKREFEDQASQVRGIVRREQVSDQSGIAALVLQNRRLLEQWFDARLVRLDWVPRRGKCPTESLAELDLRTS